MINKTVLILNEYPQYSKLKMNTFSEMFCIKYTFFLEHVWTVWYGFLGRF